MTKKNEDLKIELLSDEPTEVVCGSCSFPIVQDLDEQGRYLGFHEEPAPATEEEALKEGWVEVEFGLLCPKCGPEFKTKTEKEVQEGAESRPLSVYSLTDAKAIDGLVALVPKEEASKLEE